MRSVFGWLMSASAGFLVFMTASNALAAVVVTIGQSGNDVVASISGGMGNLGIPFGGGIPFSEELTTFKSDSFTEQTLKWGSSGPNPNYSLYTGDTGAGTSFWKTINGLSNNSPSSSNLNGASYMFFQQSNLFSYFGLGGYNYDNSPLSGSMRFAGKTMLELGLDNFGTHTYTFGSGENTDTITFVLQSPGPRPGLTINIKQIGADVVATISGGLLNLGTPFGGGVPFDEELIAFKSDSFTEQTVKWGSSGPNPNYSLYTGDTGAGVSFWKTINGLSSNSPSSSNLNGASYMFFQQSSLFSYLGLGGYNYDNSPITGTMTFTGKTLGELGFDNLGAFTYNFGSGERTGFVTFNIENGGTGGGEVPEPTSMAIFGLGALGLAYRNRRKLLK